MVLQSVGPDGAPRHRITWTPLAGGTETYTVEKRHYLIKQRLAAASRLVNRSDLDLSEIALLAGFGTRWSLFRHLRKKTGEGGGDLRKATSTMS
jgi:transcriptional regulator GlxA family with amidase domain